MKQGIEVIPFDEHAADNDVQERGMPTTNPDVDFVDNALLRFKAYQSSWDKCATRIREIMDKLYAPVVDDVCDFLLQDEPESTLSPEHTTPCAVLVSSDSAAISSSLWKSLELHLHSSERGMQGVSRSINGNGKRKRDVPPALVVRLTARVCTNVPTAIRAIYRALASQIEQDAPGKEAYTELESGGEDLRSLAAAYKVAFADISESLRPKLLLALEDIESFDPTILSDLLELLSLYSAQLPFRLLFTCSTTVGYLKDVIPRQSLEGLEVEQFAGPSGERVLEELVQGLFFDPSFDPPVMLGPRALQALRTLSAVYDTPASGLISTLQLMWMYHFYEPRSVLALAGLGEEGSEEEMENPFEGQESFADYVRAGLAEAHENIFAAEPSDPLKRKHRSLYLGDTEDLLALAADARRQLHDAARKMRAALQILLFVRGECRRVGLRVWEPGMGRLDVYELALRGRMKDVVKNAVTLVRRMEHPQLQDLLELLHTTCEAWPAVVRREERELRQDIVVFKNLGEDEEGLAEFGDKLGVYFRERFVKLREMPLYDLICVNSCVNDAMDLISPSPRSSITAALLQPQTWLDPKLDLPDSDEDDTALVKEEVDLATYPDASILFHRSLEAGKKINLLDWFESFSMALENETELLAKQMETPSPRKRRRAKVNGKQANDTEQANGKTQEDEAETREQELQARFVCSVQEMEYVGLLKHNTRRTDFAVRTVFETID